MSAHRHVWRGGELVGQAVLGRTCLRCQEYRDTGPRRVLA